MCWGDWNARFPGGLRSTGSQGWGMWLLCNFICRAFQSPSGGYSWGAGGVLRPGTRDFFRDLRAELPNRRKWKRPE